MHLRFPTHLNFIFSTVSAFCVTHFGDWHPRVSTHLNSVFLSYTSLRFVDYTSPHLCNNSLHFVAIL
jgi:hypothetical protein